MVVVDLMKRASASFKIVEENSESLYFRISNDG